MGATHLHHGGTENTHAVEGPLTNPTLNPTLNQNRNPSQEFFAGLLHTMDAEKQAAVARRSFLNLDRRVWGRRG